MARKVDVHLSTNYEGIINYEFSNQGLTGILKIGQMFTVMLFTEFGSKVASYDEGTLLLDSLSSGVSEEEAFGIFSINVEEVLRKMVQDNDSEGIEELDDRISSAEVDSVVKEGTRLTVTITINTEAGESTELILPIERA